MNQDESCNPARQVGAAQVERALDDAAATDRDAQSKVNLRSQLNAARAAYSRVAALEAERDQALFESLDEVANVIPAAIAGRKEFKELCRERPNGVRGRDVATSVIDYITQGDDGKSTLNDERRATYAAAAQWLRDFGGPSERRICAAREAGGIDEIAKQYRRAKGLASKRKNKQSAKPDTTAAAMTPDATAAAMTSDATAAAMTPDAIAGLHAPAELAEGRTQEAVENAALAEEGALRKSGAASDHNERIAPKPGTRPAVIGEALVKKAKPIVRAVFDPSATVTEVVAYLRGWHRIAYALTPIEVFGVDETVGLIERLQDENDRLTQENLDVTHERDGLRAIAVGLRDELKRAKNAAARNIAAATPPSTPLRQKQASRPGEIKRAFENCPLRKPGPGCQYEPRCRNTGWCFEASKRAAAE